MKNFFNKLYLSLILVVSVIVNAQTVTPPPPQPESGDAGALATTPIDMYAIWLVVVAVGMITFVASQARKKLIVK